MGDRSQQNEPLTEFEDQVAPLAQRLVREPSLSGKEGAVAGIVAEEMGRLGYGRGPKLTAGSPSATRRGRDSMSQRASRTRPPGSSFTIAPRWRSAT